MRYHKVKGGGSVQQERPTSKLTTGCEGVTLAYALTHSLIFPLTALHILFGGTAEHLCAPGMWE